MKIEIIIHKDNGEIRRYPVHKMVRHNNGWTATYTIIQNGRHVSREAMIDDEKAKIEIAGICTKSTPSIVSTQTTEVPQ